MPFADVTHFVTSFLEGFTQALRSRFELAAIAEHPIVMSKLAAHQRRAIRAANRSSRDAGVHAKTLRGELIQRGCFCVRIAIASHGERPFHIGNDVKDVRPFWLSGETER